MAKLGQASRLRHVGRADCRCGRATPRAQSLSWTVCECGSGGYYPQLWAHLLDSTMGHGSFESLIGIPTPCR